jgi:glycosyltransferase involved in cell wall biosynthesis
MIKNRVSVIIPTHNRPDLVCRAVNSALKQTFKEIEVIVVIDGPDEATTQALKKVTDPRLRVLALAENVGGSDARNAGVRAAEGEWVALLDDDDEWFPEKLAKQVEAASGLHKPFPVIASLFIARTPAADYVWPRRLPKPSEPIIEYMLVRNSFFQGETHIQTSTLLIKTELLNRVSFRSGLKRYQDLDWFLRAAQVDGVCFEIVPEPLTVWHIEELRSSISTESMWRYSLQWLRENRNLLTPRAYSGFVATQLSSQAAYQGEWGAFAPLLWEMYRFGEPRVFDLLLYMGMWFIPQDVRRRVRAVLKKKNR